jgi:hypothetical protein
MDGTAHGSFAFWVYIIVHLIVWQNIPPNACLFLIVIFGSLPDFDGLYWTIKKRQIQADNNFQHHLYFWSHWPISYIPLILIAGLSIIFNFYPSYFIIPAFGVYTHLICDSACCGDGMMWKKTWRKDQFAPFINMFSKKTDGYHGGYWAVRWRRTTMFKLANLSAIGVIVFITVLMVSSRFSGWLFMMCLYFTGIIVAGLIPSAPKFLEEPPGGRYDDYRKHPLYLVWMEKNGYTFNNKNHAVKKKIE